MWTTALGGQFIRQGTILVTVWSNAVTLASLNASMTVNALVTGLIVFRIFKVFREVKDITTSNEKSLGVTRERKLHSIIFIIIESGMALFAIQVSRIVVFIIEADISSTNENFAWQAAYVLIAPIHEMLNVITSSVIAILCFTDDMDLGRV